MELPGILCDLPTDLMTQERRPELCSSAGTALAASSVIDDHYSILVTCQMQSSLGIYTSVSVRETSGSPSGTLMNGHSVNGHFSRIMKGDCATTALSRHEHYLFSRMELAPGMRVLEIGCGVGTAAFELANFADVLIIGFDEDRSKASIFTTHPIRIF